jgi:prolipoprotein diacylglyceryltransferase
MLGYTIWNVDPVLFRFSSGGQNISVLWNGVLIAVGILIAMQLLYYIYRKEQQDEKAVDVLVILLVLMAVVGARVGYVLIDALPEYLESPSKLVRIWQGGFNLVGAAVFIPLAAWLHSRYTLQFSKADATGSKIKRGIFISKDTESKGTRYLLDRLSIVLALVIVFVKAGSIFNSDPVGQPTLSRSGVFLAAPVARLLQHDQSIDEVHFVKLDTPLNRNNHAPAKILVTFKKPGPDLIGLHRHIGNEVAPLLSTSTAGKCVEIDNPMQYRLGEEQDHFAGILYCYFIPRYPVQWIEGGISFVLFVGLFVWWRRGIAQHRKGLLTGIFLLVVFLTLFLTQYLTESYLLSKGTLPLDPTQMLCVPFLFIGVFLTVKMGFRTKS